MSESVASSLLVLSLLRENEDFHDDTDVFYGPIEGNFEKLEKLEMIGIGASHCFASMSGSCAESLVELSLTDNFYDPNETERPRFPERFEGYFRKLRKFEFMGRSPFRCFESISESCASCLLELKLVDCSNVTFPETLRGNFTKLEKLTMHGRGAARCFASMSASCSHSLLELDLGKRVFGRREEEFPKGFDGNPVKLEKLRLDGRGASECFASMSASCSHSLLELDLSEAVNAEDEDYEGFPKGLGRNLVKLERLRFGRPWRKRVLCFDVGIMFPLAARVGFE
eukprot:GHVU01111321.1.p1 GENE.GHVU01111321.1~~GHVU01111321.1.p1  ORF type:complete len:330 (+),score=34.47 GHVU01111321.1:140-991(+)